MKTNKAITVVCAMAMGLAQLSQATSLTWDSNGVTSGQIDGGGTWLNANQWWDVTTNATWNSSTPDDAVIGVGGAGGAITLGTVTAGTVLLNNFTGTYALSGGSLAQSGGITIGATAGNVTVSSTTISGVGGLTMNGSLLLNVRSAVVMTYTGSTVINNGVMMLGNSGDRSTGNFLLNGGMLTDYYQQTHIFTSGLGTGNNRIQIYGNSGFGGGNGTSTWRIGAAGSNLVWGASGEGSATGYFNPTTLKLRASQGDNNGSSIWGYVALDNWIDLNSGTRTIDVYEGGGNTMNSRATINSGIKDTGAAGNLIKTGGGVLFIGGTTSTWGGSTTVSGGMLDFQGNNIASIGGGSGRNITVATGAGVKFNALSTNILNRIVKTNAEIVVMTGTTANNLDFSSTGADLPNAWLGNWAGNGAKCEFSGLLMPASDNYRLGSKWSNGLLGIVGANKLTGTQGLIAGQTGGSGIRVELAASQNFTGNTVINTSAKLTLGNNLALQNSTLSLGAAGGTFALHAAFVSGHITGATASPSPTFGGLSGSRSLYSSFSSAGGNNEALLANTAVEGFTLNLAASKTNTYSGAIGGFGTGASGSTGGAMTLSKSGDGVQILSGTCTYTGATTVAAGTLGLGANNILTNSPIVLTGGVLDTGTYSNALKTLTLSGTATINLGTGGKLVVGDSSSLTWSGTLNVTGDFVKSQSLRFGTTSSGLTSEQLTMIKIVGGGYAVLDDNGYIKNYQGTLIQLK